MAQSIDQFVLEASQLLMDFKRDWKKNNEKNPEQWPLEMEDGNEGLWWEMFMEYDKPNE